MSSIDGEIFTYKFEDDSKRFFMLDENDFNKKMRAIRKYLIKPYKHWIFEVVPKLKQTNKKDGSYEIELPVDKLFKKVYGEIKIMFSVKNDVVILENIEPNDILIAMHDCLLPTYKGIPYRDSKDKFKIDLVKEIENEK